MKKRIVVALGGNALGNNNKEQVEAVKIACTHIVKLVKQGHEVVIVHGNGPQVGKIQLAFELASQHDDHVESMPLVESIALSQGYIGHHIQNSLQNILRKDSIDKDVVTLVTHTLVDVKDSSFLNPSKPIGPFYSKEEILSKGFEHFVEDSGRGYRQIVASPLPVDFIETGSVKTLMDSGTIVIFSGGGGVPVYDDGTSLIPIDAVVDKDATAALLAEKIKADVLLILTAVDSVYLNFNTENEVQLQNVNVSEVDILINENHFAPGSMLPKVEAIKRFVSQGSDSIGIITSLENTLSAIEGTAGTRFVR